MKKIWVLRITAFVFLLTGSFLLADGCWIKAKAVIAQAMLQHAWEETLATGKNTKAWPWADTWPVARLTMERLRIDLIILEGDSGEVLAFGPGHLQASSKPGSSGHCILAGHRDTAFKFLQDLKKNDVLTLQTSDGSIYRYRVSEMLTRRAEKLYLQESKAAQLTLITCYPFNGLQSGADLRYIVFTDKLPG